MKRKVDGSPSTNPGSKRSNFNQSYGKSSPASKNFRREKPSVNTKYGQEGAFPGLDESNGDEEHLSEIELSTREALAYLRMVRSEANEIPSLLVAPKPEAELDDSSHDNRGYYDDGAYVAAPVLGPEPASVRDAELRLDSSDHISVHMTPQEAFTKRLSTLFTKKRELVRRMAESNKKLKTPAEAELTFSNFVRLIHKGFPSPQHLASLSQQSVLKGLKSSTQLLRRYRIVHPQFSAWLFGLLCRLDEVGTLHSDAVSTIRELGKRAVWVGIGFFNKATAELDGDPLVPETNGLHDGCDDEDDSDIELIDEFKNGDDEQTAESGQGVDEVDQSHIMERRRNSSSPADGNGQNIIAEEDQTDALNAAKQRLLGALSTKKSKAVPNSDDSVIFPKARTDTADENTRATLDVLITIIGHMYGQRDLLEFRVIWGGENGLWGDAGVLT